jgi:hypothetical protein
LKGIVEKRSMSKKMRHGKKRANDDYIKLYGKIGMGNL